MILTSEFDELTSLNQLWPTSASLKNAMVSQTISNIPAQTSACAKQREQRLPAIDHQTSISRRCL